MFTPKCEYIYKRGNLQIPNGAVIHRSEPAIKLTTKPGTAIYYSESLEGVSKFDEKLMKVDGAHKGPITVLERPFVETWTYQGQAVSPPMQLDKVRQVYFQDESGQAFFRCVYTKDLIKPDAKQNVAFRKLKKDDYIFPTQPSKVQIRQSVDNCFLLAPIMAMIALEHGYEYILNSMRQLDDGTTIVRLFDGANPVYVQVTNCEMYAKGQKVVFHDAPWVHILENAYIALLGLKLADTQTKSIYLFPSFKMQQHSALNAMRALTGQALERVTVPNPYKKEVIKKHGMQSVETRKFQQLLEQQHRLDLPISEFKLPPTVAHGNNKPEEDLFNFLQNKFNNQNMVVAGTLKELPEIKEAAGLLCNHLYAVTRVYRNDNGEMIVWLRNPWGHTGPLTDTKGNKKEDEAMPEFEMNINDFVKVFTVVNTSPLPRLPGLDLQNSPK